MAGPPTRPFREIRQDRSISASEMNRALAELRRSLQFIPQPPLWVLDTVSGFHIGIDRSREPFWAEITSGTNPYAWKEKNPLTSGGWEDTVRGRTGTTTFRPAYEQNDVTTIAAGTIVRLYPTFKNNSSTREQEYSFRDPGPPAAGISLRETSVNAPGSGTLYSGVSELRCDYGETFQDSAGNARVGYSGRLLAFDTAAGDSAFSVASAGYATPTAVTFTTSMSPTPWATADQAPAVGNNYFSPSREGWYLLTASVVWEANATGYRFLAIGNVSNVPLNGTASLVVPPSGVECFQNVAAVVYLASGTDAYLLVAQTSGAARNIYRAYFTGQRLG
jgi:hypothetical protein